MFRKAQGGRAAWWGGVGWPGPEAPLDWPQKYFQSVIMMYVSTSFGLVTLLEGNSPVMGGEGMGRLWRSTGLVVLLGYLGGE